MLYVEALKSKKASDVHRGLRSILQRIKSPVKSIYSDSGKEFLNGSVLKLLKDNNIKQFASLSDQKASHAERSIRQLKSHIARFITARKTPKYLDNLQSIVDNINSTKNRVIGMSPNQVDKFNETLVFDRSTVDLLKKPIRTYKVGDNVRISLVRNPFAKEHMGNFSTEIFSISKVDTRIYPEVYKLKDYNGEDIKGNFYKFEMVQVEAPEKYQVQILTKKGNKYKVRWVGYGKEFDSWISKDDLC